VSVTQQFNTTTSMGRLTSTCCCPSPQFEREVTAWRIRDKIAASKMKGMWMGGVPPLGYAVRDRKLIIVECEAETVRHIFRHYAELGSVRLLRRSSKPTASLANAGPVLRDDAGAASRSPWRALSDVAEPDLSRRDRPQRPNLPRRARSDHDPALWDAAQARLAENAVERGTGTRVKNPSLLTDYCSTAGATACPDPCGQEGQAVPLLRLPPADRRGVPMPSLRIPAAEIEQIVTNRIRRLLSEPASVFEILDAQARRTAAAAEPDDPCRPSSPAVGWECRRCACGSVLLALVQRVDMHPDEVILHLRPRRLAALLR